MIDLGTVKPGSTIRVPFGSYTGSTGASSAASNFAVGDILIYKDGSTTERASTTGYTANTTWDSLTGINSVEIDLSSNATAGFFAAGSEYFVIVGPITIDSQTVNFPIARFKIGFESAVLNTTIATLSSQTSFTLTSGPADDNALVGCVMYGHAVASAVQGGFAVVSAYTGSTKTVTLTAGVSFTAAAADNVSFFPPGNDRWFAQLVASKLPLAPTTAGRDLDVSAGGEAGVDWANVGSPTTVVNLSATTVNLVNTTTTATTVTNLTNAPTAGDFTATMKTSITTAATAATPTAAAVTGNVGGLVVGTVAGVTPATAAQVAALLTTQIVESYRANGAAPTLAQFMAEVLAHLGETSITGTTKTVNKLDHVTAAATFTLDSATTPAAITRAT